MESTYLPIAGKNLHYVLNRNAEKRKDFALVLIHGFMESVHIWDDFDRHLSSQFSILRIDLPGHGESDTFSSVHEISMQANCIKAVLDAEKIEKIVLVGHSMGGYVCGAFAEQYPEHMLGLVLFHSHLGGDTEKTTDFRNRTIDLLKQDRIDFITRFIPDLFAEGNAVNFPEQVEDLSRRARQMNVEAIIASQLGMRDRKVYLDVYLQAHFPVMFIQGKYDSKSNLQKVLAQASMPAQSEILLLECGHMGFIEKAAITISCLGDFTSRAYQSL